ncbi:MAG: hypothetical protein JNL80_14500 [Phycisphaerae bacterium]|jgi:hypothetical protein|nr:hypothetical protein [Phycisphaerae bacterium]
MNSSTRFAIGSLTLVALVACTEAPKPKPPAPPVKAPNAPSNPQPNVPDSGSVSLPPSHPPIDVPALPASDPAGWKTSTATDDANKIEVAGLEMPKPATWVWQQPTMQFRTLQYSVPAPGDSKDTAELVISQFMGDGGSVQQNVDRWAGQFRDAEGKAATPKREDKSIGGLQVTLVELKGAYMGMGSTGPKENTLQLGAIIVAPGRSIFVRLNGPEKTVEAERANWDKLIEGLKIVK